MTNFTATYSPEDNKIRIYASSRLDSETYGRLKEVGFKWAPKQGLFVAPKWTPQREDIAVELAGEIEAEEMTLAERAIIKAERLEQLASKRHVESERLANYADELSQAFYMGQPILIGHHSERKARKTKERMDSARDKSHKAAQTANYWLYRATGVERFANMKNDPKTRQNRIKTLLAELRDLQRDINLAQRAIVLWEKIDSDERIRYALGNMDSRSLCASWDLYSSVNDGKMTPQEAREKCISVANLIINGPNRRRCIDHILNRLAFERSMLGDVPRYDGEVTPVILQAFAREHGAEKPTAIRTDPGYFQLESPLPLPLHLADSNYLELSDDEWKDVMKATGYIVPVAKPRRQSDKPAAPPLINPTQEEAERLQAIWNRRMVIGCAEKPFVTAKENSVTEMTQAGYSARSKGTYSLAATWEIDAQGNRVTMVWRGGERVLSGEAVARIRVYSGGHDFYKPYSVIRISDKPAKPLPIDFAAIEAELGQ